LKLRPDGRKRVDQTVTQADRELVEIDEKLDQMESEIIDRGNPFDALSRFGSLREVVAQRERVNLVRQLIESVSFDPMGGISLTFKPHL
jgi:hypothetical protein